MIQIVDKPRIWKFSNKFWACTGTKTDRPGIGSNPVVAYYDWKLINALFNVGPLGCLAKVES